MLGVGIIVVLTGYGLGFWGYQKFSGCSASFIDVMWPGKFQPCSQSASSSGGGAPGGVKNPGSPPGGTVPGNGSVGTNPFGVGRYGPSAA